MSRLTSPAGSVRLGTVALCAGLLMGAVGVTGADDDQAALERGCAEGNGANCNTLGVRLASGLPRTMSLARRASSRRRWERS